jgi:hypothetical protein
VSAQACYDFDQDHAVLDFGHVVGRRIRASSGFNVSAVSVCFHICDNGMGQRRYACSGPTWRIARASFIL